VARLVDLPLGILSGFLLIWAVFVAVLWATKPGDHDLAQVLRMLPDLIRLIKRLATDPATPRGARIRLVLLLGYLFLPFDVIPDFLPVVGYVDDAIIVAMVLRSAIRRAGPDALATHWPRTTDELAAPRTAVSTERKVSSCDSANNTRPRIRFP
jgi:uncharacterized membrane protein YkvA (DUF1232 family)